MQLFSIFILHLARPICCQCHVLNLKTCQAYWPMDTWNVLLSHMSYSELASNSEGNLLPCAVGEECRLTKWWAAKGTKDMPQPSQLEKRAKTWQNMAKHDKISQRPIVSLSFGPVAEARRWPQSRSSGKIEDLPSQIMVSRTAQKVKRFFWISWRICYQLVLAASKMQLVSRLSSLCCFKYTECRSPGLMVSCGDVFVGTPADGMWLS